MVIDLTQVVIKMTIEMNQEVANSHLVTKK